jgi:hypothetical protein
MWLFLAVDDFEGHGDGMGADHAVALDLREATGADVFHVGRGREAQAGGEEAGTGPDRTFEQGRFVTGGFDFAGGADFAGFENDRPSSDGGEELFGERNHAED